MRDEDVDRVRRIGQYRWRDFAGHEAQFLSEDEVKKPHHPLRTLTGGGAQGDQPPHRRHDPDARGAALAQAPHQGARVRGRAP